MRMGVPTIITALSNQVEHGNQNHHRNENRLFRLHKAAAFLQVLPDDLEHTGLAGAPFVGDANEDLHDGGKGKAGRGSRGG